jgi:hypothetical protein
MKDMQETSIDKPVFRSTIRWHRAHSISSKSMILIARKAGD